MPARSARRLRRWLAIGIGIAAGLAALLAGGAALLLDADAVAGRVAAAVAPRAARALGRAVTVRAARLDLLPAPRVRLEGVTVAGADGAPPLLLAEALDLQVALWPLVRSLGADVQVEAAALLRPTVNLVREADGGWSAGGAGGAGAGPPGAAGPDGPAVRVALRELRVAQGTLRLVDRAGGGEDAAVALDALDLRALRAGPGMPLEVRVAAALAGETQDLHLELSVAALPEALPRRPEEWPVVQGTLRVGGLALDRLRALLPAGLGAIVRGGAASLQAAVSTPARGRYRAEGTGEVRGLELRGQPASARFRAVLALAPGRPGDTRLDLVDLTVRGPGVDLGGHASLALAPLRAWFVVTGALLDLDAVMGPLPPGKAGDPPARRSGPLLPAALRAQVASAAVRGTLALEEVRAGRITAHDVRGEVVLAGGALALERLDAAVLGGHLRAAGSRVALEGATPRWRLAAALSGIDAGEALRAFSGAAPLGGALDGTLEVSGAGSGWEEVRGEVTGVAALSLRDGILAATDLDAAARAAAARARPAPAGRSAPPDDGASSLGRGRTELGEIAGRFRVEGGALVAEAPLRVGLRSGEVTLSGAVGLDGALDLRGVARLRPAAPADAALVVPLELAGTLERPAVSVPAGGAEVRARRAAEGARDRPAAGTAYR